MSFRSCMSHAIIGVFRPMHHTVETTRKERNKKEEEKKRKCNGRGKWSFLAMLSQAFGGPLKPPPYDTVVGNIVTLWDPTKPPNTHCKLVKGVLTHIPAFELLSIRYCVALFCIVWCCVVFPCVALRWCETLNVVISCFVCCPHAHPSLQVEHSSFFVALF